MNCADGWMTAFMLRGIFCCWSIFTRVNAWRNIRKIPLGGRGSGLKILSIYYQGWKKRSHMLKNWNVRFSHWDRNTEPSGHLKYMRNFRWHLRVSMNHTPFCHPRKVFGRFQIRLQGERCFKRRGFGCIVLRWRPCILFHDYGVHQCCSALDFSAKLPWVVSFSNHAWVRISSGGSWSPRASESTRHNKAFFSPIVLIQQASFPLCRPTCWPNKMRDQLPVLCIRMTRFVAVDFSNYTQTYASNHKECNSNRKSTGNAVTRASRTQRTCSRFKIHPWKLGYSMVVVTKAGGFSVHLQRPLPVSLPIILILIRCDQEIFRAWITCVILLWIFFPMPCGNYFNARWHDS